MYLIPWKIKLFDNNYLINGKEGYLICQVILTYEFSLRMIPSQIIWFFHYQTIMNHYYSIWDWFFNYITLKILFWVPSVIKFSAPKILHLKRGFNGPNGKSGTGQLSTIIIIISFLQQKKSLLSFYTYFLSIVWDLIVIVNVVPMYHIITQFLQKKLLNFHGLITSWK